MTRHLYAGILAIFAVSLFLGQVTLAQNLANTIPIQTGFAVITPLAGGGQGLSVSETFTEQVTGILFQSSVLPSPLVTLTNVVVNLDPNSGMNTGLAVVNPNDTAATVSLSLLNQQGAAIGTRTMGIGGRQQVSRFVTELFAGIPESRSLTGQLFISSNVPVGVLGLSFNGPSFSSLPVATQLSMNSVVNLGNAGGFEGNATIVTPQTFTFSNALIAPPVLPITGNSTALVNATGQITATLSAGTAFPGAGVGGTGALLLSQIATGGGWVTQITIANTSTTAQVVRVDFFSSAGGPMTLSFGSTLPSVLVPPGGVVTLSTSM